MSSKQPRVDAAKTKLALSRTRLLRIAGVALAVAAMLAAFVFYQVPPAELHVAGKTISLEIVRNEATQAKGLSGRGTLPVDRGMLFVFDAPAKTCFWMKGMQFPLDIIWLNDTKKVVQIARDVAPESYPKSFCPGTPAKYVLELNAGQARELGIDIGDRLSF